MKVQPSRQRRGHFILYNCLILGNTKYKGVRRISCDPFPNKLFYWTNKMDLVFIRPLGVQPGGFVLTPHSVWYCRVLLLFSTSALTDTGSKKLIVRYSGCQHLVHSTVPNNGDRERCASKKWMIEWMPGPLISSRFLLFQVSAGV